MLRVERDGMSLPQWYAELQAGAAKHPREENTMERAALLQWADAHCFGCRLGRDLRAL